MKIINFLSSLLRNKKVFLGLVIFIATLFLLNPLQTNSKVPEDILTPPTIISPSQNQITTNSTLVIEGVVYNNSKVDVYIDGKLAGRAKVKNGPQGIASWSFVPSKLSIGFHTVYAVSRSENEVFSSKPSNKIKFQVKHEVPAPILFDPVIQGKNYKKPVIRGLAKSNLWIEVYIDGKLNGRFKTPDHPSKTASFTYKPFLDLKPGWHSIKVRAREGDGRVSRFSRPVLFEIRENISKTVDLAPQLTETPHPRPTNVSAPTLLKPETKKVLKTGNILIEGLAWDEEIEIYINNKFFGYAKTLKHPNGIVSFAYKPPFNLQPDDYQVYAIAKNNKGQKSSKSNTIHFIIKPQSPYPIITPQGIVLAKSSVVKSTTTYATTTTPVSGPEKIKGGEKNTVIEKDNDKQKADNKDIIDETKDDQDKNELIEKNDDTIVDDNKLSTGTVEEKTRKNKTAVIIAIIAIIIIGIISWLTSKERVEELEEKKSEEKPQKNKTDEDKEKNKKDDNNKHQSSNTQQTPQESQEPANTDDKDQSSKKQDSDNQKWQEEPVETPPPPPSI